MVATGNGTASPLQRRPKTLAHVTVRSLIDQRAQAYANTNFLLSAESDLCINFGELQHHSRQIEKYLDHRGIERGQTAALMMGNGCWTATLMLGIMYSGRVVLPLNVVAGAEQIEYVIEHSDLKIIFCSSHYQQLLVEIFEKIESVVDIVQCNEDTGPVDLASASLTAEKNNSPMESNQTALMVYTSGTTGRPKGVLLSHKNVIAGGDNTVQAHQLTAQDRSLCVLPLYHINAEMVSIMAPLVSGGSVVISHRLSISKFWNWILDHQCTWYSAVPTIFSYLIEHQQSNPELGPDKTLLNKQLRFARSASAALPPATRETFESLFGVPIIETMGISECAAHILSNPINRSECKVGSSGIAFGNEVRIVDSSRREIPAHAQGEIAVRGDNIMQGYYKNPEATQQAIDDDGWFYTGDIGFCDNQGFVFVTGRIKELIIKGGENIAPREIDDVLYKHPSVLEATAFGVPDKNYGQEIMAAVSLKPNTTCNESTLLEHCEKRLGKVKSPKRIHILNELPKGPSGKIQRLNLQQTLTST